MDEKYPTNCKECGVNFNAEDTAYYDILGDIEGDLCKKCAKDVSLLEKLAIPKCEWPGCNNAAFCNSGNFNGNVCSDHFKITNGEDEIVLNWVQITELVHYYQNRLIKKIIKGIKTEKP